MRALVMGGTGFLGTSVVSQLRSSGHHVTVFHRGRTPLPPGVAEAIGDRHDLDSIRHPLRATTPDVVIDLIACSGRQAAALMRVFRGVAGRVIVASSMDVYRAAAVLHRLEGGTIEPTPLTERSRLRTCAHTYPAAQLERLSAVFPWIDERYDKLAVEQTVANDPELPATVLRLPMMYGPGDRLHRLRALVGRMDDGRKAIPLPESLARWRAPRGYVENVAAAFVLAATLDESACCTYNVAESAPLTELEWAAGVARVAGWHGDLAVLPDADTPAHLRVAANLAQHWNADSTLIRRHLGYTEPVAVDEAVHRTIAWERGIALLPQDVTAVDYEAEDAALAAATGHLLHHQC
jgi:nucleoside-diphosphate-sugar epimerase